MKKVGLFVYFWCFIFELWSLKCQKSLIFVFFSWHQQKIRSNWCILNKLIWKISFSCFRKCYGLLGSGVCLRRYYLQKLEKIVSFCWVSSFFKISNLSHRLNGSQICTLFNWKFIVNLMILENTQQVSQNSLCEKYGKLCCRKH